MSLIKNSGSDCSQDGSVITVAARQKPKNLLECPGQCYAAKWNKQIIRIILIGDREKVSMFARKKNLRHWSWEGQMLDRTIISLFLFLFCKRKRAKGKIQDREWGRSKGPAWRRITGHAWKRQLGDMLRSSERITIVNSNRKRRQPRWGLCVTCFALLKAFAVKDIRSLSVILPFRNDGSLT